MSTLSFSIAWPREWMTADPFVVQPLGLVELSRRQKGLVLTALLRDGTSLWAVVYPGGQRLARTTESTDWAVEERFTGDPPRRRDREKVEDAWRRVIESMVSGIRAAREHFDGEAA